MNVPDDLLYTETHEWIKREGENVRMGITDHAQSELTDVVYVELPKMDRQANAKQAIAVVESVKAASDIYAPVKGTAVEINKALEADPGLIVRYEEGMNLVKICQERLANAEQKIEIIARNSAGKTVVKEFEPAPEPETSVHVADESPSTNDEIRLF